MSYFHDASVAYNGKLIQLTEEEGRAEEGPVAVWYGPGEPSAWLGAYIFWAAKRKLGDAPDSVVLELAAKSLGVPVEKVRSLVLWVEQYTQWHDGAPAYRILRE